MNNTISRFVLILFCAVFLLSCTRDAFSPFGQSRDKIGVEEAEAAFAASFSAAQTKSGLSYEKVKFASRLSPGEYAPDWLEAETHLSGGSVELVAPLQSEWRLYSYKADSSGVIRRPWRRVRQELVVRKANEDSTSVVIRSYVQKHGLRPVDRFSGLVIETSVYRGGILKVERYSSGQMVETVSLVGCSTLETFARNLIRATSMIRKYSFFRTRAVGTKDDNGAEPDPNGDEDEGTEDDSWLSDLSLEDIGNGFYYDGDGYFYYDSDGDGYADCIIGEELDASICTSNIDSLPEDLLAWLRKWMSQSGAVYLDDDEDLDYDENENGGDNNNGGGPSSTEERIDNAINAIQVNGGTSEEKAKLKALLMKPKSFPTGLRFLRILEQHGLAGVKITLDIKEVKKGAITIYGETSPLTREITIYNLIYVGAIFEEIFHSLQLRSTPNFGPSDLELEAKCMQAYLYKKVSNEDSGHVSNFSTPLTPSQVDFFWKYIEDPTETNYNTAKNMLINGMYYPSNGFNANVSDPLHNLHDLGIIPRPKK